MSAVVGSVSVVSVRGLRAGDPSVVYVGRACAGWSESPLGNPFRVGPSCSRQAAIARYRGWLWGVVQARSGPAWEALLGLVSRVQAGESVVLGCWCSPLPCHGEVIASAVQWLVSQGVCRG